MFDTKDDMIAFIDECVHQHLKDKSAKHMLRSSAPDCASSEPLPGPTPLRAGIADNDIAILIAEARKRARPVQTETVRKRPALAVAR